ncbi:MAG: InlB B-repeat-containing protein [Clostridiales bacterium]|jgi:uncharacterized repeat protein (TIGR02543 family)|nr:InlB B-repeat-containing protein [Clostridiales bacterium]
MKIKKLLSIVLVCVLAFAAACGNDGGNKGGGNEGATYTVIFNGNGGTETSSITKNEGEKIQKPTNPTKQGYTFDGWYYDSALNNKAAFPLALDKDYTLYAKWISNIFAAYTLKGITIKSNVANEIFIDPNEMTDAQQQQYDSAISMYGKTAEISADSITFTGTVLELFNPANYRLDGKNIIFSDEILKSTFSYVTLENGIFSLGFVTDGTGFVFEYYAPDFSYNLLFDYDGATGGNAVASLNAQYNENVGELPEPTKTGYVFHGWKNKDTGAAIDRDTKFIWRNDVVAVARWAPSYTINTKEEFISFAQQVNGGQTYTDTYVTLTTNIDLSGAEWTPIGDNTNYFDGNFDGDGYKISNFQIPSSHAYSGLFGYNQGVIKNLDVENLTINITLSATYIGGLVGDNRGTVANCSADGNITVSSLGVQYVGGLVGDNRGTVADCSADGSITVSNSDKYVGGLAGHNWGDISNSYAANNISVTSAGTADVGGLAGKNYSEGGGSKGTINKCYATGNVTVSSSSYVYAGGLVGDTNGGSISDCYATGDVTATDNTDSFAGGLIGRTDSYGGTYSDSGKAYNCYATGTVIASASGDLGAGGLVGNMNGGSLTNCFAVTNRDSLVGSAHGTITNCSRYTGQAEFDTQSFYTDTLKWSTEIWDFSALDFADGKYPMLKF